MFRGWGDEEDPIEETEKEHLAKTEASQGQRMPMEKEVI